MSIENGTFILWVNNGTQLYGLVSLENYLNQWVHFAVVRQIGISSVYQNGSRIINYSTPSDVTNNTDPLKIGFGSDNWWNGKITNFRWVKGSSVYDGTQTTITVPTAPLAAISGTKLLLLTNSNETYLADSSGLNKSATNNGSVTWSSDSPDFTCCDTLTFVGVNANTTGNSAIKLPGGGWDGSAYSTETYTSPVSVTFKSSTTGNYLMGGFSYNPTGNPTTYLNTTYGLYIQNGFLEIYEYGGQVSVPGSISTLPTDVWRVDYNGTNVKYYQNNNLIYTSSNSVTQPLHVFFALLTGEQGVTDICVEPIVQTKLTPTLTPTPMQPVNCVVGAWGAWSTCDADCGGGTQTRYRDVIVQPANGGTACPDLSQSRACNTQPCVPTPTPYLITYPDPGGLSAGYTAYIYGNEWDNTIEYFGTHGTVSVVYGPGSSVGYGLTNFGAGVVKEQGYFLATTPETHTFYLSADSGSYLWIGSHALSPTMSNYDLDNVTGEQSININLVPGDFLPFLIVYAQPPSFNSGTTGFNLSYSTPTISKTNNWGYSNAWRGSALP